MQLQNPNTRPRWGDLHTLKANFPISRSVAYLLLKESKIRAKKFGSKTIWDLDSAEAYFASLPDVQAAA